VLPRTLHDPRHGSLQALRFLLDLIQHGLGEIKALLPLVAFGDVRTALVLLVGHAERHCDMPTARESRGLPFQPAPHGEGGAPGAMQAPMSRTVVRAVRIALAGLVCNGCSAGESGPGPAARSRAASGDDADASPSDALIDAGSEDGATNEEAIDWCTSQGTSHLLCEDFDHGVPGGLTSKTYGGGIVAADVSDYVSAPESMWASTPALAGPHATAGALATASFATLAQHLQLQADFQIAPDCIGNGDGVTVAVLTLGTYSITLRATPRASDLVELSYGADGGLAGSASHPLTSPIANNAWSTVVLDLDLPAQEAEVTVDGQATLTREALTLEPSAAPASAILGLGAEVTNQLGQSLGCRVRVDNVLFDSF
jgi:hypothetical protein